MCACVNMYVGVPVCHGVHVWRPEDNLTGIGFLLPKPCVLGIGPR